MARVMCNACRGTYETVLRDGRPYFHACAPLSAAELELLTAARVVTLPPGESIEDAMQQRTYERSNKRDENIRATKATGGRATGADDAGVTPLADAAPGVVVVGP